MFFEEKDVESWKNDIKHYFAEKKRKEVESVHVKKVTHRDVKQKEVDYHPILQKFQSEDQVFLAQLAKFSIFLGKKGRFQGFRSVQAHAGQEKREFPAISLKIA